MISRHYKIFFSFLFFSHCLSFAQVNLVPNPSFEQLTSCPTTSGQIYKASPWFSPYKCFLGDLDQCSSSDVYSTCFIFSPGVDTMFVPKNGVGFQYPRTGNNYAGIAFWLDDSLREYIEVKLLDSLLKDTVYCVSYFVSNTLSDTSATSTSNIQLAFTNDTAITMTGFPINTAASIKNPDSNIISDTANWVLISGCYKALGGEKFLTIGNFYTNANSIVSKPTAQYAYYFIDDVSIISCPDGCNIGVIENKKDLQLTFYPNPSNNYLTVNVFSFYNNSQLSITDIFGVEKIITEINSHSITINTEPLENGIYFLKVKNKTSECSQKIIINH